MNVHSFAMRDTMTIDDDAGIEVGGGMGAVDVILEEGVTHGA